jgi:hypothetical protein
MAARLGNVIYWAGWIIAILAGLLGAYALIEYSNITAEGVQIYDDQKKAWRDMLPKERENHLRFANLMLSDGLKLIGVSFGSWVIGRVARYILAGR